MSIGRSATNGYSIILTLETNCLGQKKSQNNLFTENLTSVCILCSTAVCMGMESRPSTAGLDVAD